MFSLLVHPTAYAEGLSVDLEFHNPVDGNAATIPARALILVPAHKVGPDKAVVQGIVGGLSAREVLFDGGAQPGIHRPKIVLALAVLLSPLVEPHREGTARGPGFENLASGFARKSIPAGYVRKIRNQDPPQTQKTSFFHTSSAFGKLHVNNNL